MASFRRENEVEVMNITRLAKAGKMMPQPPKNPNSGKLDSQIFIGKEDPQHASKKKKKKKKAFNLKEYKVAQAESLTQQGDPDQEYMDFLKSIGITNVSQGVSVTPEQAQAMRQKLNELEQRHPNFDPIDHLSPTEDEWTPGKYILNSTSEKMRKKAKDVGDDVSDI